MKKLVALTVLFFVSFNLFAQDEQAEMKAWQEYMTPGPMHEMLSKSVGNWNADITMWMAPDTPPTTSKGTYTTEAIMGGRYFQSKHSSNMMGMPMEGLQIIGYDNALKKFFTIWLDNFGTGYLKSEGTYDEATKTLTFIGTGTDHRGREYKMKEIIKDLDDNSGTVEMFMEQDGKEFKSMEIKFTRQ